MTALKKSLVAALEHACGVTHNRPVAWLSCRLHIPGCLLANWSAVLDERWQTNVWGPPR